MRDVQANPDLVACCGLYCGACRAYLKERCGGCRANEKASWCKVRACCMAKRIANCAACDEFDDARQCRKFSNFISKIFGVVFRSDRAACIDRIGQIGTVLYAEDMAARKQQTIRR